MKTKLLALSMALGLSATGAMAADAIIYEPAPVSPPLHAPFDWTGFYRVTAPEMLKIGPYQGGHGCLVIPFSRGVCGAAARTRQVQLVPDVEAFPGHIACASSTRSELVIPVVGKGERLIGVLDIDSDRPDAFTQDDADRLQEILDDTFGRDRVHRPLPLRRDPVPRHP